jgi:hypothetical protein
MKNNVAIKLDKINDDIKTNHINTNNNNKNRALNFIFNSSNKIFKKESQENENNTEIYLTSNKKEIFFKLSSFSQEKQKVIFSSGIEEIFDDTKDSLDDKFIFNISNKKFSTPPRNTKSSYKKTKEHIKTPYRTTKSRTSKNKTKKTKENNKSSISTKSSNYWKSLLFDEEMVNKNIPSDVNIDINRNCNSVILENPYKIEFKLLFNDNFSDDNEEDLNKSI